MEAHAHHHALPTSGRALTDVAGNAGKAGRKVVLRRR